MFTEFYSRRMWMIDSNKLFDIFGWSAKDEPLANGTRDAYKGSFIGYPVPPDAYNGYFERMVEGVEVVLGCHGKLVNLDHGPFVVWAGKGNRLDADVVVNTGPIDELCGNEFGELPYAGRDFHLLMLPCKQVFPGDVRFCHYAGANDEWTRVTEFKKLTYHEAEDTLLVLEKPSKANKLYPYLTKANEAKVKEYAAMLPANVHSIGRLGTYRYTTIENTIAQAAECVAKITGKPNELCGQFFAIGDTSMLPKDRKEAAA